MTSKNEREVPKQNQQIPQGYPPPDFYAQHGTPPAYSYPAPAGYSGYPPQQQGYYGQPNYYQGGVMAPTLPPGYYNQQQPQQQASGWLQGW